MAFCLFVQKTFLQHDVDNSGKMDARELRTALAANGVSALQFGNACIQMNNGNCVFNFLSPLFTHMLVIVCCKCDYNSGHLEVKEERILLYVYVGG